MRQSDSSIGPLRVAGRKTIVRLERARLVSVADGRNDGVRMLLTAFLSFSFRTDQYKTHTLTKTNVACTNDAAVNLLDRN